MSSDIFTGTLEVLILQCLKRGKNHGYAIGKWIRENSDDVVMVEEGALYPALHRLKRDGLLESVWGTTETGRRAKIYDMTEAGIERLRHESDRWAKHARAVSKLLGVKHA